MSFQEHKELHFLIYENYVVSSSGVFMISRKLAHGQGDGFWKYMKDVYRKIIMEVVSRKKLEKNIFGER